MKLIVVSGLSGSGKSVALSTLEDGGYYCVDNLPIALLPSLAEHLKKQNNVPKVAVGIDIRSGIDQLDSLPKALKLLRNDADIDLVLMYLYAEIDILLKRFSETRRKHPLDKKGVPLLEALELEMHILEDLSALADVRIDTSRANVHQLRGQIKDQVLSHSGTGLRLMFQSFGFKHGSPRDSDFVFDVRCLPNPHWDPSLRKLTGQDPEVAEFLSSHDIVNKMQADISQFIENWVGQFEAENRNYLTISIGCTGGQHRSVYLTEQLHTHFKAQRSTVSMRHRELS